MEDSLELSDPLGERPCARAVDFRTVTCATPERTVVRAYGEIDLATGAAFRAALVAGLDRRPALLVVDLDGLSFLDACGLGVLVGVANRAALAGIQISVVGTRPHVYRLFDLTRLVDRLDVHSTPAAGTPIPDQTPPEAAAVSVVLIPVVIRDRSCKQGVSRTGPVDRATDALVGRGQG